MTHQSIIESSPASGAPNTRLAYDEIVATLKDRYRNLQRSSMIAAGRRSNDYSVAASAVYHCVRAILLLPEPLAVAGSWRRLNHGTRPARTIHDYTPGPWHYFGDGRPALCGVKRPRSAWTLSGPWRSEFGEEVVPENGDICRKCLRGCDPRYTD